MAIPSAADAAASWAQNLSAAGQKIQNGVNAVKVAPGQLAARQKAVYVQNVTAKADTWASRVAGVSLTDWQSAMTTKAVPRIATGATAAQSKMESFMGQLLPYIQTGQGQLPARGNLTQNKQRVMQWIDYMASFKKK